MKTWTFRAVDTWFFRDGTPFHQGEGGDMQPKSLFPPLMMTLQGAIRTAMARTRGWSEQDQAKWPKDVLGNEHSLGRLRLRGPYLKWQGQRLYPLPLVLIGKQKQAMVWLLPGAPMECDLGQMLRMLQAPNRSSGRLLQAWVNKKGWLSIVNHQFPQEDDLFLDRELYHTEQRLGIQREHATHQAIEGHLYMIKQIRPHRDLRIEVDVIGTPSEWELPKGLTTPLGGEGRFTEVSISTVAQPQWLPLPDFKESRRKLLFTVSLLTPGCFSDVAEVIRQGPLSFIECISASIGKPFTMGGWDLKKEEPRESTIYLPAGSTWYYETDAEMWPLLEQHQQTAVGEMREYGYGEIAMGRWEEKNV